VLLAELEIFHTRRAQPTRRLSLGNLVLPVDPSPGFGGLLLGAIVARHAPDVEPDLRPGLERLIREIADGRRIVQPRLRHRFQVDQHGLARSTHRLLGDGDDLDFEFGTNGSDLAMVLGAIYAVERLALDHRRRIAPLLVKGLAWRGPIGAALIAHLAGASSSALASLADPRGWALELLGFEPAGDLPSKREMTRQYRQRMRDVHPDHGGEAVDASKAILDLNEARRILQAELGA
jgi:hypothetical protein